MLANTSQQTRVDRRPLVVGAVEEELDLMQGRSICRWEGSYWTDRAAWRPNIRGITLKRILKNQFSAFFPELCTLLFPLRMFATKPILALPAALLQLCIKLPKRKEVQRPMKGAHFFP